MPLFVLKEETESLDIDAIVLPSFKGVYGFYLNNTFNNKSLYDLLDTFSDEEKIQNITEQEKSLKSKLEELIKINRNHKINVASNLLDDSVSWGHYFVYSHWLRSNKNIAKILEEYPALAKLPEKQLIQELESIDKYYKKEKKYKELERKTQENIEKFDNKILTLNKLNDKYIITFNVDIKEHLASPYSNYLYSNLSKIYENIIKLALKKKITRIAIPIIDFYDMPDPNYYINLARDKVRDLLEEEEIDITVYLLLTNENNDYCQDRQPENIYEKIACFKQGKNSTKGEIEKQAKEVFEKYKEYLNKKNEFDKLSEQNKDILDSDEYSDFMDSYRNTRYEFDSFAIRNKKHYSDEDYLYFFYDYLLYKNNYYYWLKIRRNYHYKDKTENIIDETEPDVNNLKYWDEKAFWEKIHYSDIHFELNTEEFPKYRRNNKKILKKLGEDLKSSLAQKDLEEESLILCEFSICESKNLQKEIQSLIETKKESFSQMVLRIIKETNRNNVACYKAANVNKNIFSKILKDANGDENKDGTPFVYNPDKKIVFAFSIALRLKLDEAEELLQKAGYAFSDSPLDIIVKTFIQKGIYDIDLVNQFLFRFNQPLLGSTAREN